MNTPKKASVQLDMLWGFITDLRIWGWLSGFSALALAAERYFGKRFPASPLDYVVGFAALALILAARRAAVPVWTRFLSLVAVVVVLWRLADHRVGSGFLDWVVFLVMVGGPAFLYMVFLGVRLLDWEVAQSEKAAQGKHPVLLGGSGKAWIGTEEGCLHTQILGATGTGKTAFVMKPAMEQAIQGGLGCFIYDVKSNLSRDVAYYVSKAGRDDALRYLDLGSPERSQTYNPLYGDEPWEVANRLITALYFNYQGEPYYRDLASSFLSNLIPLLSFEIRTLTFEDLYHVTSSEMTTMSTVSQFCQRHRDTLQAKYFLENWLGRPQPERMRGLSGLVNRLERFVSRSWSPLVNVRQPRIRMEEVFQRNQVFLLGTSAMLNTEDAKPLAIMALLDLSNQVGKRLRSPQEKPFDVFLDEFYNLAYPGFIDLLNKAREAKVRLFLAHQSMGDLMAVSQEFTDQILTNTQNKIILRSQHPPTAEYFAKVFGTQKGAPQRVYSYDTRGGFLSGPSAAGFTEMVPEEFRFHPNTIKELSTGQAVVRLQRSLEAFDATVSLRPAIPTPMDFDPGLLLPIRNLHKQPSETALPLASEGPVTRKEDLERPTLKGLEGLGIQNSPLGQRKNGKRSGGAV